MKCLAHLSRVLVESVIEIFCLRTLLDEFNVDSIRVIEAQTVLVITIAARRH